ncbi:type II secretion system F family protein [Lentzea sp. BCCO 10_0856]|uniref:Type II secretion system F family protein n=1 Tax=Lentzea miocenica TaxID=3095431 RepID=A0ABU4T6W3_9PSEU|nr:type II secretion system F family protein [Lentzea sp. BCCO 10_0856]MDX8033898.1 type II secretion system F family protein [Lentzea sp. BCCO 10_0856]
MTFLLLALAILVVPVPRRAIDRLRSKAHDPPQDEAERTGSFERAAAWDLLAACLEAGLPVPTAIQAVAMKELSQVAELLRLGADPVTAWAPALDRPETAALARAARRTARSGAALARQAAELAERTRAEATNEAEAKAQKAAVAVAAPLALCFLPAFLCLGVMPVVLGLADQFLN